jgi:NAD(P)-dependent dehydrogenase (short-subunit alcohol dehydrogenase family)
MTGGRDPLDFTGRVVLVTGGGRGVGRGISERFLEAGADVAVCGRTRPETLPAAGGREAVFVEADVRESEAAARVVDAARERFGRLDVLVNNAGGSPAAPAASASPRFSEAIIRLNLIAPLHFSQAANAVMQRQATGGVIVNISSSSGVRPSPGTAAYGAAKAGLIQLSLCLAHEWGPKVRVVPLVAGLIATEQAHLHYGDEAGLAAVGNTIGIRRMGRPDDIGDVCVFLASPLARFMTGGPVYVDGGGEGPAFLHAAHNVRKDPREA